MFLQLIRFTKFKLVFALLLNVPLVLNAHIVSCGSNPGNYPGNFNHDTMTRNDDFAIFINDFYSNINIYNQAAYDSWYNRAFRRGEDPVVTCKIKRHSDIIRHYIPKIKNILRRKEAFLAGSETDELEDTVRIPALDLSIFTVRDIIRVQQRVNSAIYRDVVNNAGFKRSLRRELYYLKRFHARGF